MDSNLAVLETIDKNGVKMLCSIHMVKKYTNFQLKNK